MQQIKEHLQGLALKPGEEIIQNDFENEQLTPEEENAAIQAAKHAKYLIRKRQEYWERVDAARETRSYTASQLHSRLENSITSTGKKFVIDFDNERQIQKLCLYFSNDPEFEKDGEMFHRKGIMLAGGLGVGKTHLMSFFFQNQVASYAMVPCGYIENKWINAQKDDQEVIKYYSHNIPSVATNSNPFGATEIGFCFDDLGTETIPSKRWGEEKNVMAEILTNRYTNVKDFRFTHLTTNLTPAEIQKNYGDRLRDRFREMFNYITFDSSAKSRRH
jgi:DNA replication protein DnaC